MTDKKNRFLGIVAIGALMGLGLGTAPANAANPKLRSCAPSSIAAQINAITSAGKRRAAGHGIRYISQVQADVLGQSISIYEQAMNSCSVDRNAYQNAINQLKAARAQALRNVNSTSN